MPVVQAAFPTRQDAFIAGMATKSAYRTESGVIETAAGLPFAAPVQRGSVPGAIALFAAGAGAFLGIAKLDHGARGNGSVGATNGYATRTPAAYFTSADGVAVPCDLPITAAMLDTVVRYNTVTGRYTNAAASGTVLECTGWTFDNVTTAAGQLTVIKR
jgi:hypothetical protein